MKSFALIIFSFYSIIGVCADWKIISKEEYTQDLNSLEKVFSESMYQFDFKYKSFAGHQTKTSYDELKGHYTKWETGYLSSLEGQLTICEKKLRVSINEDLKSIIVAPSNPKDEAEMQKILFDYTLNLIEKIEKSSNGEVVTYRLTYSKDSSIEAQEVVFKSGLISKLIYFYSTPTGKNDTAGANIKPRMELEIEGFSKTVQLSEVHQLSNYVREVKNEYSGVGKYVKYEVLKFI